MKILFLLSMMAFLVSGTVLGQDQQGDSAKPESNMDRASYGIGMNMGKSLKKQGLDVNTKMLVRGLLDAVNGKEPALNDEELNEAFAFIQKQIQKKQAELRMAADPQLKAIADKNKAEGDAFLADNGKKEGVKTTKSGLQYLVLNSGNGATPKATDTVKTHYHGTLIDGTVFDSSVERKQPASFPVNGVISGWTEALQLMKVGDKWRLFVPSDLAYGLSPRPGGPIGPNAVLVFEVELLEVAK